MCSVNAIIGLNDAFLFQFQNESRHEPIRKLQMDRDSYGKINYLFNIFSKRCWSIVCIDLHPHPIHFAVCLVLKFPTFTEILNWSSLIINLFNADQLNKNGLLSVFEITSRVSTKVRAVYGRLQNPYVVL